MAHPFPGCGRDLEVASSRITASPAQHAVHYIHVVIITHLEGGQTYAGSAVGLGAPGTTEPLE
jgi:hypothetical protein